MIDYNKWAINLLEEIYYAPEEQRASIIEEHLNKAHRRGYTDGSQNEWWKVQEREMTWEDKKDLYKKRHWR